MSSTPLDRITEYLNLRKLPATVADRVMGATRYRVRTADLRELLKLAQIGAAMVAEQDA